MVRNKQVKLNSDHFEASIKAIDTHTQGEFTRIVIDGFPEPKGDTMLEKMAYVAGNFDHYRSALMDEPRGHKDMFGALWTEPVNPEADFGAIFMDGTGYMPMCGHGSMGSATAAVEAGIVNVTEPYTYVNIEAPAGLIKTKVKVENGKAKEVSIINVPSFLYKEDLHIQIDEREITYDISFGGNFMALIDATQLGLNVTKENLAELTDIGIKMLEIINREVEIQHPELAIDKVATCEFFEKIDSAEADNRNVVVFGNYQADRSPCGAGTSCIMATKHARGELFLNETFTNESILGRHFKGTLLEETKVGDYLAVIPQITGSSNITGYATYLIDPDDHLKYGFHLN